MNDYEQQPDYNQNTQFNANQPSSYNANQPSPYNANQPPPYQPQQYHQGANQWPHMRIGDWIVTSLLMLIPIVNIVLMFVWAFGGNVNPSKKSFFQAALIFSLIGVILSVLFIGAAGLFLSELFSQF